MSERTSLWIEYFRIEPVHFVVRIAVQLLTNFQSHHPDVCERIRRYIEGTSDRFIQKSDTDSVLNPILL